MIRLTLIALGLALATPAAAQTPEGLMTHLFDRTDHNADGAISQDELAAMKTAQFARIDANGDGQLSAAELTARQERMARIAALVQTGMAERATRLDQDGDGSITLPEFTARNPMFGLIDVNGDGAVSRAEFDRARAAFAN
ncbi:MAG: EF-hand domain-containing protein [Paracoccaceae bacterium]